MERKKYRPVGPWISAGMFFIVYSFAYAQRYGPTVYQVAGNEYGPGGDVAAAVLPFLFYAVGSFINGRAAARLGGKYSILLGMGISTAINLVIRFAEMPGFEILLWIVNSYFQSFVWIGAVLLIRESFGRDNYGAGVGICNASSGISHIISFAAPAAAAVLELPLLFMFVFVVPTAAREKDGEQKTDKSILKDREFILWCAIAFLSSMCRYGLLKWIPVYYESDIRREIFDGYFYEIVLALGMAFGTLVLAWSSEKYFHKNRGVPCAAMAAACAVLMAIFPQQNQIPPILTGIFLTGFFLYGINGILWLTALSKKGRTAAARAAGILNGFAYAGAAAEEGVSAVVPLLTENASFSFFFLEAVCILLMLCALTICKKNVIMLQTR